MIFNKFCLMTFAILIVSQLHAQTSSFEEDFYVGINQSLVDQIIDALCPTAGCIVFDSRNISSALRADDKVDYAKFSAKKYNDKSFELVNDNWQSDNFSIQSKSPIQDVEKQERQLLEQIASPGISASSRNDILKRLEETQKILARQEMIDYATIVTAKYVLAHKSMFDQDIIDYAASIEDPNSFSSANGNNITTMGLGGFFKKVGKSIKGKFKKIRRWGKKQLKKNFKVGKPSLDYLIIKLNAKPAIKLGNPLKLVNFDINPVFKIIIPYTIFGKNKSFRPGSSRLNIEKGAIIDFHTPPNTAKIQASASLTKLKIRFKLLGIRFRIGLTTIANKMLKSQKPIELFDASELAPAFKFQNLSLGLKVESAELKKVSGQMLLPVKVNIQRK